MLVNGQRQRLPMVFLPLQIMAQIRIWYGVLTQTGFTQTHTLSFGGGTNKLNYRASLTAISQDGVVINSSNKKYIARVQATQKGLDDKLKLTFNLNNGVETSTRSIADLGRSGQVSKFDFSKLLNASN